MADAERPHFSNRILRLAETAQAALGNSAISQSLISAVAGAKTSAYRQLSWQSKDITTDAFWRVSISGDPDVRKYMPARMWHKAAVLATNNFEADPVWEQGGIEALAYITKGVTHVGTLQDGETLFKKLNDREVAIGMRLGQGAVDAVMGIWLPDERHFIGAPNEQRGVTRSTPVSTFAQDFPGLILA